MKNPIATNIATSKEKFRNKIITALNKHIEKYVKEHVHKRITELETQIKKTDEKFENIPYFTCFVCKNGIVRSSGSVQYMEKYFHPGTCFKEYLRIIEKPDAEYKEVKGVTVKEFFGDEKPEQ